MYYVYMLRCIDNSIYTGITNNLDRRMNEHFSRNKKCAKYTLNHNVSKIECVWETENRILASKLEFYIKKIKKSDKEKLILNNNLEDLLFDKIDTKKYVRKSI